VQFREHQLENGLDVIAECNPAASVCAVGFFVKTGARDEDPELSGVSHFLEHMVFKGTEHRGAADVNRELDEIGAQSNAYTSEEQTVYFLAVLPEYIERGIDLLADIMRPSLRTEDFEMEKQVILEEIAKYDDQPPYGGHEKAMALHFSNHPLSGSVLGTTDSVGALDRDQMAEYWLRRYSPGNMTLVATGQIDFDQLVRQAERLCGDWQPHDVQRATPRAAPAAGDFELIHKPAASQQYMIQLTSGPAAADSDRYAGRVMATVFGDDVGGRMFWELVDSGKAEVAALEPMEYDGTGVFMSYLCSPPELAGQNQQAIERLLAELRDGGITTDELHQAQNKICSHIVLGSERTMNRLFAVESSWLQRHRYRAVAETVAAYKSVTTQDVAELLQRYPLCDWTTITVGPMDNWPDEAGSKPES